MWRDDHGRGEPEVLFDGSIEAWGGLGRKVGMLLRAANPSWRLIGLAPGTECESDARVLVRTTSLVDAILLDRLPNVRLVQQGGAGINGIDVAEANRRGVAVANVPTNHSGADQAVAEHALALILTLLKGFNSYQAAFQTGTMGIFVGSTLRGKTVGIVGYGRIGRRLAELLAGFGVELRAINRTGELTAADSKSIQISTPDNLDDLLARSDIVVLACPLSTETIKLIGARELALCKPGAYLINIARGALLDEPAALVALQTNRLGGLGLDVFAAEPPDPAAPLLTHPRVVASPHVAAATPHVVDASAKVIVENICRIVGGQEPCFQIFR